jgi:hypothetical protein
MNRLDIPQLRLYNQRLSRPTLRTPGEVVDWLCAVQAQEYLAAKWALGTRMRAATDDGVERAFAKGAILRTHVLRPTWHFVRPADIRWMLALTAPRIRSMMAYRHRQLELDEKTLRRSGAAIAKALEGGGQLTRDELRDVLRGAGIVSVGVERMTHIMMRAELDGIVCSGARRGKQFTYALLDERVSDTATLDRDEALQELARRYFKSRGPATVQDFAKWSGLTVADARNGLEAVQGKLRHEVVEGRTYWFPTPPRTAEPTSPTAYFLSIFDEYISGYKNRSAIAKSHQTRKLVGMATPYDLIIVIDGQVVGTWKRALTSKSVTVQTSFFERPTKAWERAVRSEARRYGEFLGLPVVFT